MNSSKKIALFSVVGILFLLFLLMLVGDNGLLDYNRLKARKAALAEKNAQVVRENISMYREIERMKNDPSYVESVARQELGVIAEDEMILKVRTHPSRKQTPRETPESGKKP